MKKLSCPQCGDNDFYICATGSRPIICKNCNFRLSINRKTYYNKNVKEYKYELTQNDNIIIN